MTATTPLTLWACRTSASSSTSSAGGIVLTSAISVFVFREQVFSVVSSVRAIRVKILTAQQGRAPERRCHIKLSIAASTLAIATARISVSGPARLPDATGSNVSAMIMSIDRAPLARLVAISDGKGGVGKTSASLVVWSSLWTKRPDAVLRFDIAPAGAGSAVRWTLTIDEPVPDDALTGHLRRRVNELINANLRYSFGQ